MTVSEQVDLCRDIYWAFLRPVSHLGYCPGKNIGVGCHFLLQCMKVKSESEVAQSCPTPSDPMDCSLPGSSVHGIFQARVLEWGAIKHNKCNGLGLSRNHSPTTVPWKNCLPQNQSRVPKWVGTAFLKHCITHTTSTVLCVRKVQMYKRKRKMRLPCFFFFFS